MKSPHQIRYETTKRMRWLNPRGVWRVWSLEDQARWTQLGPAKRMRTRREMRKAKRQWGTIAWMMEVAVLPPRPVKSQ